MVRPPATRCGNANVEVGESCDDGNGEGGDGCSRHCRREPVRFLSWYYVQLADGAVVLRETGQALPGRVTMSAPEAALIETKDGLRYFYGGQALLSLPGDERIAMLGAGLSPCVLSERGVVWCLGGELTSVGRPSFELGPRMTVGGVTLVWNKLRRAAGTVAGLAGNLDVGCILLDAASSVQCWGREPAPPYFGISPKMALGRGRAGQQLVAGGEHFCVRVQNGEVGCWGDSSWGQTGYMAEIASEDRPELPGPERRRRLPPTTFLALESPAKQLAASGATSCALLQNGKLWCWGDTDALAFEDPAEPTFAARMESDRVHPSGARYPKPLGASTLPRSPIKLPSGCNVKDFSLVSGQLCVSCEGGCSKCWGLSQANINVKRATPPDECLTF
jgi:cysteine-rich repeat protein